MTIGHKGLSLPTVWMVRIVRVEGLEPPMGKTHQILNLAPIPVRLHPRVGRVGFEPTTYGLRIRCSSQIELATQLGD